MKQNAIKILTLCVASGAALYAQPGNQRNASIVGGGGPDHGKCTIEVVVDGVVEVEVRGTQGVLRNISGQPAQWRRFECTSPMPSNPVNFNFSGVDGRGRQSLVRDPRNSGSAVVQIEDREGGSEGYTFDLTWGGGGNNQSYDRGGYPGGNPGPYPGGGNYQGRDPRNDPYAGEGQYRPGYQNSDYYRRYNHGFGQEEAVRVCQNEVQRQAAARFRGADVHFDRTRVDDQPGRQDWIIGSVDVHRGNRGERFRYSCSVDFNNGRVRSATLDPVPEDGNMDGRRR